MSTDNAIQQQIPSDVIERELALAPAGADWYVPFITNLSNYKGSSIYFDVSIWFGIACNVVRKIASFEHIIGIQPMWCPVGLVDHSYAAKQPDSDETTSVTVQKTVEAASRKLQTTIPADALQDLSVFHGEAAVFDAITHAVCNSVVDEISAEIFYSLHDAATPFNHVSDTVTEQIVQACDDIKQTVFSPGNFVVCSEETADRIIVESGERFKSVDSAENAPITFVGILDDKIRVYVTSGAHDKVLVGYKGNTSEEAGYVYCPYVPVLPAGTTMNQETFEPIMHFVTRRGTWKAGPDATNAYYRTFSVK